MQSEPGYTDQVRMDPADFNPKKDLKGKAKETEAFESWVDETVNEYAKMGDFPRDKEIEKKDKENATKLDVTKADKMMNSPAYQKMKAGDPKYTDKTEGMGDKIADMAQSMSKEEFIKAHGERYAYIWDRVQAEMRGDTMEAKHSKPDYLDFDKDGDKKEPMKKALKDKEKKEQK